jgi:mannosyltransferase OCH1-like enzyme
MSRKADVARYEILLRRGGIYLDCEMMPYQHLDFSSL